MKRSGVFATGCIASRFAFLLCLLLVPRICCADDVADEIRFASGLIDLGLPDLAEHVLDRLASEHPDRRDAAASIRARLLIAQRKWDEAATWIELIPMSNPDGVSVRLALATGYHLAGKTDEANALFEELFSRTTEIPEDESALAEYRDIAVTIARMLEGSRNWTGAATALDRIIASRPEPEYRRQVQERQAGLYLRAAEAEADREREDLLVRAEELAGEIEYGGPLWVARAAVIRAQVARDRGRPEQAIEILDQNRATISSIDKAFESEGVSASLSPKAGYHYVRGLAFRDLGVEQVSKARGAEERDAAKQTLATSLNEFARVLKSYNDSDVAIDASIWMKSVEEVLVEELGATLQNRAVVAAPKRAGQLFATADTLFNADRFEEAIEEYLRVLNRFPETSATPSALTHLGQSYGKRDDGLMARTVAHYLGERFAGNPEAAKGCLMLASFFQTNNQADLALDTFDVFVRSFPAHPKAPQVLYTVALQQEKRGSPEIAERYFSDLLARYPDHQYALKALRAEGWHAYERGDYDRAQMFFNRYVDQAPPGLERVNAMMLGADSWIQKGDLARAYQAYGVVTDQVSPLEPNNPYAGVAADAPRIQRLVEQAAYQAAYCLATLKEPENKIEAFRTAAIRQYDAFIDTYPESELAPRALAGKGAVLLEADRLTEATETFEQLARQYPDTPEGRSGLLTLVGAALDVGRVDIARDSLRRMVDDPAMYGDEMFVRAGQMMAEKGFMEESVLAFQTLLDTTEADEFMQRALYGLGGGYAAVGDCTAAIESLDRLVTEYPRSALLFDAYLLLGKACGQCERYADAIEALTPIFRMDADPHRLKQANFELAAVQEKQGRTRDAYASYLRLGLHPDPTADPAIAPLIRASILRSITLGMELQDYASVVLMSDTFLAAWPGDAEADGIRKIRGEATMEQARQGPAEAGLGPIRQGGT